MKEVVLLKDSEKYEGKYVAKMSFISENAISSGDDPVKVYEEAKNKGVAEPVIFMFLKKR